MFFSVVWIFIARKAIISNIMVMFTVTLASFPIKIIFLAIIALGGLFFLDMNQIFFGGSFLLGTILSLFRRSMVPDIRQQAPEKTES